MKGSIVQTLRSAEARERPLPPPAEPRLRSDPTPLINVPIEALLGAILADHQPGALCVVQFVACGGRAAARAVALAFAAAASLQFGRTLALETDAAAAAETPGEWAARPRCPTELVLRQTTPDAALPGLSHARVEAGSCLAIRTLLRDWSDAPRRPFAMVVLDSPSAAESAQAVTFARSCTATILVAEAGISPLAVLRDTQGRLVAAKAALAGFVFVREGPKPPRALTSRQ